MDDGWVARGRENSLVWLELDGDHGGMDGGRDGGPPDVGAAVSTQTVRSLSSQ